MRRWKVLLTLLLLTPMLVTTCGGGKPEPECPIKVGIIVSLAGNRAASGKQHLLGYEMAVDEINAAGGILGCQVELVIKDDESVTLEAQVAMKDLVEEDQVLIVMGTPSSNVTIVVAGMANVYKVPLLVPTAASDLITDLGHEWVFRINAPSSEYANTALAFAQTLKKEYDISTLAIVYHNNLFGESAAVAAATTAAERGFKVVAYETYKGGADDYTSLLTRVKDAHPDVIYFASYLREAELLMKQCAEVDLNPKLYLGNAGGFVDPGFPALGKYTEYVIATAQWRSDVKWPGAAEFTQKFRERNDGAEPGMRSAQTYTALYVVKDAIERAGGQSEEQLDWTDIRKVRQAIRDALEETDLKETIFGPIKFNLKGQNAHPVLLIQVIDGKFVTVYPEEYQARAPIVPVPSWAERQSGEINQKEGQ